MTTDSQLTTDSRDALAVVVRALLEGQLAGVEVAHCWPEENCVLIRTGDGKQGDVEVAVNWDVVPTELL